MYEKVRGDNLQTVEPVGLLRASQLVAASTLPLFYVAGHQNRFRMPKG
jgi:hypothetical protein